MAGGGKVVEIVFEPDQDAVLGRIRQAYPEAVAGEGGLILQAIGQIEEYFHGNRRKFDLPLDLQAFSPYTAAVLSAWNTTRAPRVTSRTLAGSYRSEATISTPAGASSILPERFTIRTDSPRLRSSSAMARPIAPVPKITCSIDILIFPLYGFDHAFTGSVYCQPSARRFAAAAPSGAVVRPRRAFDPVGGLHVAVEAVRFVFVPQHLLVGTRVADPVPRRMHRIGVTLQEVFVAGVAAEAAEQF